MAESKNKIEIDLLKNLNTQTKIVALKREIELIHFLPSTNIDLDPKRNCGNLHKHLYDVTKIVTNIMMKRLNDHFDISVLLPAATLFITGIANCGGLSAYAYYRWFVSAEFKSINELPILIFFKPKNKLSADSQDHGALGVNITFDETSLKKESQIEIDDTEHAIILDFWLNIIGPKISVINEIYLKSGTSTADLINPVEHCRSLADLRAFQIKIQARFKSICEELNRLFEIELSRTQLFESSNVSSLIFRKQNYYTSVNYHSLDNIIRLKAVFPIDIKAAHEDLHKCYDSRKDIKNQNEQHVSRVLSNITRLWGYLIKNVSNRSLTIFKDDPDPSIQQMVVKHRSPRCSLLFQFIRKCCGSRPKPTSSATLQAAPQLQTTRK